MRFQDVILSLERAGVADILLPFVLVFTVVYAVLGKSKIFGREREYANRFNVIFSLIMAFGVIFPHVTGVGPNVVPIINSALPNVAALAIALIMFMFLVGVWGEDWSIASLPLASWIVILTIGAVVYIFGDAAGWGWQIPNMFGFLRDPDTQSLIVTLLVFGLIIGYITREPKQPTDVSRYRKLMDGINIFKGGGNQ